MCRCSFFNHSSLTLGWNRESWLEPCDYCNVCFAAGDPNWLFWLNRGKQQTNQINPNTHTQMAKEVMSRSLLTPHRPEDSAMVSVSQYLYGVGLPPESLRFGTVQWTYKAHKKVPVPPVQFVYYTNSSRITAPPWCSSVPLCICPNDQGFKI